MNYKEQAIDLVNKMSTYSYYCNECHNDFAKDCALIAVDEILNSIPSRRYWDTYDDETPSAITFWQEVKTEIEKL